MPDDRAGDDGPEHRPGTLPSGEDPLARDPLPSLDDPPPDAPPLYGSTVGDGSDDAPPDGDASAGPGEPPSPGDAPAGRSFLTELPILILIAFGLALLLKTFLVQAFFIPSGSMEPTLQIDDRVLVNKLVYRFRDPRRGEIIVFAAERGEQPSTFLGRLRSFFTEGLGVVRPKEKDFIKRVIALPGETIRIDGRGRVFITPADGGERFRLREPYLHRTRDLDPFGPRKVPEGSYFVMGDNRTNSSDSRETLGPVAREDIIGKAFMRIWPPRRLGFFRTPSYQQGADQGVRPLPPARDGPRTPDPGVHEHHGAVPVGAAVLVGLSCRAWSPTDTSRRRCSRPASASSRASTRPAAARSPARSSPAR